MTAVQFDVIILTSSTTSLHIYRGVPGEGGEGLVYPP